MPKTKRAVKNLKKSSVVAAKVAKKVSKKTVKSASRVSSKMRGSRSDFQWNPILTYIIIGLVVAFLIAYLAINNDFFKSDNNVDSQKLPANAQVQIETPSPTPAQ